MTKFEQQDREREYLIAFYKRFTKPQINALYGMMLQALNKLELEWSMVLGAEKKLYCNMMQMKLDVMLEMINEI